MTNKHAYNLLKSRCSLKHCPSSSCKDCEYLTEMEALEKQIPKKPNKAFDHTWGTEKIANVCPCCDYYLGNYTFIPVGTGTGKEKVIYCENCGQAILWED